MTALAIALAVALAIALAMSLLIELPIEFLMDLLIAFGNSIRNAMANAIANAMANAVTDHGTVAGRPKATGYILYIYIYIYGSPPPVRHRNVSKLLEKLLECDWSSSIFLSTTTSPTPTGHCHNSDSTTIEFRYPH